MVGLVNAVLPPLREELTLHPAPTARDGSPVWTLADPGRNRFFRIDWLVFEILSRWGEGSIPALLDRLHRETTLTATPDDVAEVTRFLANNHLLRVIHPEASRALTRIALSQKGRWLNWLLHHYLFFRIPLVRPDRFLEQTLHWVAFLFSPRWFWFLIGVGATALFLLSRQWDPFLVTLRESLTMTGLAGYAVTLMGVKSLHELGHAYTAKRHGCRVPSMGVAFLVLLPMLYTDTTDAWKLPDKRQRLAIALGGLAVEAGLALLALLAWNLLPPGNARDLAFWIATTSLVTGLTINISPFMRFDGYFVLSDALDLPNLHERSFQMARWWLREILFRLEEPPPEATSPRMRLFFVLFALATWLYRLLLFLGIALLVYHFFIKLVGIFLFAVEIGWFVVLPIWKEMKLWPKLHPLARTPWRIPMLMVTLLIILLAPLSRQITAPALARGVEMSRLYVPEASRLVWMRHPAHGPVAAGEKLLVLSVPDLERQKELNRVRLGSSAWEMAAAGLDTTWARRARVAREERDRAASTLAGLEATEARLVIAAPHAGEWRDVSPELREGTWLQTGTHLGSVVASHRLTVEAYPGEKALGRLRAGTEGRFIPESPDFPSVPVRLDTLEPSMVTQVEEPILASITGGPIPVRMKDGLAEPEAALFRIRVSADPPPSWPPLLLRGTLHLDAAPQSLLEEWTLSTLMVLVREWQM